MELFFSIRLIICKKSQFIVCYFLILNLFTLSNFKEYLKIHPKIKLCFYVELQDINYKVLNSLFKKKIFQIDSMSI